jgi:hypothetical protein
VTVPELAIVIDQRVFCHLTLEILDTVGQGVALTGVALINLESANDLTV